MFGQQCSSMSLKMASHYESDINEILSTVNDDTFHMDDWNRVVIECTLLSARWYELSIYLGLSKEIIDDIKRNHHDDIKCCWHEALSQWIKQNYKLNDTFGLPSWRTLLKAVAKINKQLFKELASKHQITSSSMRQPTRKPEISASNTDSSSIITSSTGMTGTSTTKVPSPRKLQLHSQDTTEKTLPRQRIPKGYDPPLCDHEVDQSTVSQMRPKHSLVPVGSVPHIESSVNTTAKSLIKKGALEGSQDQIHLRVSHSEISKYARKLVRSFPGIQQSPSDKPTEEQSLAIGSTFLQEFSFTDSADSFTHTANHSRSSCQLHVPTNAESFIQRDHSKSSGQLYMPVNKTTDLNTADSIIYFSLRFDQLQSRLIVRLRNAIDLQKEFSKCDPFVVLHLEPNREETFQSKVVKNTSSPDFGQTFRFEVMSVECIKRQTLVLRIYNHAFDNKTIGKVCFPLDEAVEFSGAAMRMKITCPEEMENNYQGDLLFSLEYDPLSRTLAGVISRATYLTKHDVFGKSDPYVKVVVSHYDMIVHKFKTSEKNKTLAPVYNESFGYTIAEDMRIDKIAVSLFVIGHNLAKRNNVIGVVNIGKNVATKLGREHWHQVLQSPRKEISFWHPIQLATSAQKRRMRSRSPSPAPS